MLVQKGVWNDKLLRGLNIAQDHLVLFCNIVTFHKEFLWPRKNSNRHGFCFFLGSAISRTYFTFVLQVQIQFSLKHLLKKMSFLQIWFLVPLLKTDHISMDELVPICYAQLFESTCKGQNHIGLDLHSCMVHFHIRESNSPRFSLVQYCYWGEGPLVALEF